MSFVSDLSFSAGSASWEIGGVGGRWESLPRWLGSAGVVRLPLPNKTRAHRRPDDTYDMFSFSLLFATVFTKYFSVTGESQFGVCEIVSL